MVSPSFLCHEGHLHISSPSPSPSPRPRPAPSDSSGSDQRLAPFHPFAGQSAWDLDEAVASLVLKEGAHAASPRYMQARNLHESTRQNAVCSLLKVHSFYRFGPITAVLAVNYVDRFMSRYEKMGGKAWMVQLLSVACLSLAAKMEEPVVPLLFDLQEGEAEYFFESRTIQRMELLVLSTLEWRMSSVTPFSYIDKLIPNLGINEEDGDSVCLVARISDLILATLKEARFLDYPPSAIAVGATLCAIGELLPSHFLHHEDALLLIHPYMSKDACIGCYHLMNKLFGVEPSWRSITTKRYHGDRSPLRVLDASFSYQSEMSTATKSVSSRGPTLDFSSASPSSKKKRRVTNTSHLDNNNGVDSLE